MKLEQDEGEREEITDENGLPDHEIWYPGSPHTPTGIGGCPSAGESLESLENFGLFRQKNPKNHTLLRGTFCDCAFGESQHQNGPSPSEIYLLSLLSEHHIDPCWV